MIIIIGLVILVAAVVAGLAGVVVGALAMFGLSLLLAGARRSSRRGHEARRGLMQSRRETAAVT